MKSQFFNPALTDSRTPLQIALLVALLLAGVAMLSRPAVAASGAFGDCDGFAADLKSLDVPGTELPLDDAEHIGARLDDTAAGMVARDGESTVPDPGAPPVLLLSPRVADIVRNVFETLPVVAIDDGTDDTGAEQEADALGSQAPATDMPPIVRAPSLPKITLPGAAAAGGNDTQYVPRFQTPMYRTDI